MAASKTYEQKRMAAVQRTKDIELFQACMMYMHPGQDLQVKFRGAKHRDFSGYWVWDITQFKHVHTTERDLRGAMPGKLFSQYHKQIVHRSWRNFNVIIRLAEKIKAGTLKPEEKV